MRYSAAQRACTYAVLSSSVPASLHSLHGLHGILVVEHHLTPSLEDKSCPHMTHCHVDDAIATPASNWHDTSDQVPVALANTHQPFQSCRMGARVDYPSLILSIKLPHGRQRHLIKT